MTGSQPGSRKEVQSDEGRLCVPDDRAKMSPHRTVNARGRCFGLRLEAVVGMNANVRLDTLELRNIDTLYPLS
jgi:hypothetical protein